MAVEIPVKMRAALLLGRGGQEMLELRIHVVSTGGGAGGENLPTIGGGRGVFTIHHDHNQ